MPFHSVTARIDYGSKCQILEREIHRITHVSTSRLLFKLLIPSGLSVIRKIDFKRVENFPSSAFLIWKEPHAHHFTHYLSPLVGTILYGFLWHNIFGKSIILK